MKQGEIYDERAEEREESYNEGYHDGYQRGREDAIDELEKEISENVLWTILFNADKEDASLDDTSNKIINYFYELLQQVKGAGE